MRLRLRLPDKTALSSVQQALAELAARELNLASSPTAPADAGYQLLTNTTDPWRPLAPHTPSKNGPALRLGRKPRRDRLPTTWFGFGFGLVFGLGLGLHGVRVRVRVGEVAHDLGARVRARIRQLEVGRCHLELEGPHARRAHSWPFNP